ncbi:cellulase family glycosylhydrolase [Halioxenophilus aromaticivorans]|uniref:Endoglucanase n=1 Tax=Halioxenophilus aromaticivorans TaxID=1306992 RepID=A0AAV3U0I0_9ALTE
MLFGKERRRTFGLAALAFLTLPVNADVPPLSVSGNQVLSGGEVASFAGNSFFWSNTGWQQEKMYNSAVVQWLKQDWNTKIVRVALGADEGGSYLEDPVGNLQRIQTVVDAAIDNDLYVIIDFHSHHAEDKKDVAINFFTQMAERYGDNNHVIYEIYNEPLQVSWSQVIKPYAQDVISAIRAIDPDNLIVVGTPTWSQDVDVASQDPIDGTNIAYALHFYAGTHGQFLRDKAQTALNNGVALMVTEWGAVNADGNGGVAQASVNEWMSFLSANNLSHVNWAVSDKNEGASIIYPGASPTGNWSAADLTPSGTVVKGIISNWAGAGDDNGDNGAGGNGGGAGTGGGGDNGGGDNGDPEADVTCEHLLVSQWHGGFQGAVRITNHSSSPINGWQVHWNYSDNTIITNSWGGNVSGSYSASNVDWNATVAPQQSVEVGFIASGSGNVSEVTGEICGAATGGGNEEVDDDLPATDKEAESAVQRDITNDWGSGYCADVTVSNPSSAPLIWSIELPVDGVVDNAWNTTWSQNGSLLLASGVDWNAELAAGEQTQFGYCAHY